MKFQIHDEILKPYRVVQTMAPTKVNGKLITLVAGNVVELNDYEASRLKDYVQKMNYRL
jgi:hypothetical protein